MAMRERRQRWQLGREEKRVSSRIRERTQGNDGNEGEKTTMA
jgi:hypothetical protein